MVNMPYAALPGYTLWFELKTKKLHWLEHGKEPQSNWRDIPIPFMADIPSLLAFLDSEQGQQILDSYDDYEIYCNAASRLHCEMCKIPYHQSAIAWLGNDDSILRVDKLNKYGDMLRNDPQSVNKLTEEWVMDAATRGVILSVPDVRVYALRLQEDAKKQQKLYPVSVGISYGYRTQRLRSGRGQGRAFQC